MSTENPYAGHVVPTNNDSETTGSKVYTLVSLIVLGIGLLMALVGFGKEIMMSMKDYKPFAGMTDSAWVGLQHLRALMESSEFMHVVGNTVTFNLKFAGLVFVLGALAGYALLALPSKMRQGVVMLGALIVFVPASVYSHWWMYVLGSEPFLQESVMSILHPLLSALKYAGIPIAIIFAAGEGRSRRDAWLPVKGAGLFALSSLAFIGSGLFSMTFLLSNPVTMGSTDVLDMYILRSGLMQANFSSSAAANVLQMLLSAVSLLLLFIPLRLLYKATFLGERELEKKVGYAGRAITAAVVFALFTIIYFLPYWVEGGSFEPLPEQGWPSFGSSILLYFLISLAGAIPPAVIAMAMAGAFRSKQKIIVWSASIALSIITLLTIQPFKISSYMTIREMGMLNTLFAVVTVTSFSAAAVWAVAAVLRLEAKLSILTLLSAAGGMLLLQTALNYGNFVPSYLYITDTHRSPVMMFMQMTRSAEILSQSGEAVMRTIGGLYGYWIALPPLLLYVAAHMFLPKRQLLLILSGGLKK
ncbi:hypothetical protein [Paenibacillus sp. Leaf72]|uniref:hypothetical protein n=1 Tax=Paenibacillus sp. Leaf72 TaxID=1736234 RepID=UPI0006F927C4|nr:hypothetical protein [Paenibacillus sp. Leaf72]KQO10891.1 hypothetical protein ASF12_10950 [Paenibacillus sp. Leaf72]